MWRRFFGPLATIVGIDIDPECRKLEEDGISIRIGDQGDAGFLASLVDEFGDFDVVIDDGSHRMDHIRKSFDFLYPRLSKNGLYIVEDLHTAYWEEFGGGVNRPETFINVCKNFIDELNADHARGAVPAGFFSKNTFSMSFYDSMVVFERGSIPVKKAPKTGRDIRSASAT